MEEDFWGGIFICSILAGILAVIINAAPMGMREVICIAGLTIICLIFVKIVD